MKARPDTSDEEKETGCLPDVIAIGLSLSGRKCCFQTNAPCSNLYLATCTLSGHWVSVLTKICCRHNERPAEPND